MTAAIHQNSVAAAKAHDRTKAQHDRRLICEHVARMGAAGCTDEDLERAFVVTGKIHANSLRVRRGELQRKLRDDGYVGHGFITASLGEMGRSASGMSIQKYHITDKGLDALVKSGADDLRGGWCVVIGEGEA